MQFEHAKRQYSAVLDWNKSHRVLPSIVGKNACMLIEITACNYDFMSFSHSFTHSTHLDTVNKCLFVISFSLCFKDAYGNGWYLNLDGVDCLKNKAKHLTIIS